MEENKKIVELQAEQLELVVSEKTIGSLTTNAKQIRDLVQSALPKYDISNYSTDDVAKAKEDKALLNKAAKTLNDKRIAFEKEFMAPFGEFKEVVNETVKLIKDAVSKIDTVIKEDEERSKAEKLASINALPEKQEFEALGISLDRIFEQKWLNKSTSLKSIATRIAECTKGVKNDLETLKSFAEDYDVLVVRYKESLNLNDTVAYANQLKAQREATKAAKEAEEKEQANSAPAGESEATAEATEVKESQQEAPSSHNDDAEADAADAFAAALGEGAFAGAPEPKKPVVYPKTYEIHATDEQFKAIGEYLEKLGVNYEIQN